MELSGLLKLARRQAWILVAATVLAAASGFVITKLNKPYYEAQAELLVGPVSGDFQTLRAAGNLAQTYAQLVLRRPFLQAAIRRSGVGITPDALEGFTSPRANELTRILTIVVRNDNAENASKLANGLAAELVAEAGVVKVIEFAQVPSKHASPTTRFVIPLAAIAGLIGAFLLLLGFETITDRVREPSDMETLTAVPCVPVPTARRPRRFRVRIGRRKPHPSPGIGLLSETLEAKVGRDSLHALAVIPADDDGAAAEVALGLASSLGSTGHDVFVMDADRRQWTTARLGFHGQPGLAELLASSDQATDAGTVHVRSYGLPVQIPRTLVIGGGASGAHLRDSDQAAKILQRALNEADRVVIAGGSPLQDSESLRWARATDGVVLVATSGQTRRKELTEAVRNLKLAGVGLVGTVLRQPM